MPAEKFGLKISNLGVKIHKIKQKKMVESFDILKSKYQHNFYKPYRKQLMNYSECSFLIRMTM